VRNDGKRYPLSALVEACGLSEAATARLCGLSGSTLQNARRHGLIEKSADRYACRAGLVPWLIWSDWLDDLEVECANDRCETRFVPSRKGHRFCTTDCYGRQYDRDKARERYRADAEFAAAERARAAEYRKAAGRAIRLREAQYRADNAERLAAYRKAYYRENREELLAKQRERDRRRAKQKAAA
jgi:hypothetical protein